MHVLLVYALIFCRRLSLQSLKQRKTPGWTNDANCAWQHVRGRLVQTAAVLSSIVGPVGATWRHTSRDHRCSPWRPTHCRRSVASSRTAAESTTPTGRWRHKMAADVSGHFRWQAEVVGRLTRGEVDGRRWWPSTWVAQTSRARYRWSRKNERVTMTWKTTTCWAAAARARRSTTAWLSTSSTFHTAQGCATRARRSSESRSTSAVVTRT